MSFRHDLAGGNGNLAAGSFQSPGFTPGHAGWQVTRAGVAEFNDVTVRGTFLGADFEVNAAGTFFYAGRPGPGTLLLSDASAPGTDRYGNDFYAGRYLYGPAGSFAGLVDDGATASLLLRGPGASKTTVDAQAFGAVSAPGQAGEYQWLVLTSGKSSGQPDAALQLRGAPADGSGSAQAVIEFGGTVAVTIDAAGISAGDWRPMTLSGGWTITPTGFAQYRRMPDGTVAVRCAGLAPGDVADGTTLWEAPAGYGSTFAGTMSFGAMVTYQTAPSAVTSTPEVVIKGSALQCFNLRGTVSSLAFTIRYYLT